LTARQRVPADRGHLLIVQGDAINAHIAHPRVERGLAVMLRAADQKAVRGSGRLVEDLRGVHGNPGGLTSTRAVQITRQHTRHRIEHDGEVDPLVLAERRCGGLVDLALERD
jgi:hypothetical protein